MVDGDPSPSFRDSTLLCASDHIGLGAFSLGAAVDFPRAAVGEPLTGPEAAFPRLARTFSFCLDVTVKGDRRVKDPPRVSVPFLVLDPEGGVVHPPI